MHKESLQSAASEIKTQATRTVGLIKFWCTKVVLYAKIIYTSFGKKSLEKLYPNAKK